MKIDITVGLVVVRATKIETHFGGPDPTVGVQFEGCLGMTTGRARKIEFVLTEFQGGVTGKYDGHDVRFDLADPTARWREWEDEERIRMEDSAQSEDEYPGMPGTPMPSAQDSPDYMAYRVWEWLDEATHIAMHLEIELNEWEPDPDHGIYGDR